MNRFAKSNQPHPNYTSFKLYTNYDAAIARIRHSFCIGPELC